MRRYPLPMMLISALLGLLQTAAVRGQDREGATTRVFRVSDMVIPTPQYPFQRLRMPGQNTVGRVSGGGGGTMAAPGGFGGEGGGFFSVDDRATTMWQVGGGWQAAGTQSSANPGFRFSIDELIETVIAVTEPDSWNEMGGDGSIRYLGGMLVVYQTPSVHEKIGRFLDSLRVAGGAINSVTIRVNWLLLDSDAEIPTRGERGVARRVVDRHWLSKMAKTGARGQITCLDGQTVHLVSGNFRRAMTSVTPVVGQLESRTGPEPLVGVELAPSALTEDHSGRVADRSVLAQVTSPYPPSPGRIGAVQQGSRVGYQPVLEDVNLGAVLQVTPALIQSSNTAVVDLQSTVIRPYAGASTTIDLPAIGKLDRINLVAQQFMTTLRMPLDEPILVGGGTLEPSNTSGDGQRLYLVIEVSSDDAVSRVK